MKPKTRREFRKRTSKSSGSDVAGGDHKFLIAAIGASAGGIEAFTELIRNLPADTGSAFILIQHLDPKHHSMLTELLGRETRMPVKEVKDGMRVEPNELYVIPPNASMTISNHTLKLGPREEVPAIHMPIDHFMRSLAEAHGESAIGVILSGSGSDGTLGLAEIQAQGGVTLVQDESSAKYNGMPRSAINSGRVDYVLPPKKIARELARIAKHPFAASKISEDGHPVPAESVGMNSIFQLLRRSSGVDFTHYRQTTILRRIQRRMVVHQFEKLDDYVKYIRANPSEIKALYEDMLINVTSFFRNPRVFDAIKSVVFPAIFKRHGTDVPIRMWTPGCASGEETYSLAIALLEYLGDKARQHNFQIFGTDVSETSIAKARTGSYLANIEGDVSPERLQRYFTNTDAGYSINKRIRDMCIFAQHNVLHDPPFSQMDVICCRNLLIYLEPVLQNKVISVFHYAARPNGFLVLGTAEGVGTSVNLWNTEDRAAKIYSKRNTVVRQMVTFSLTPPGEQSTAGPMHAASRQPEYSWNYSDAQKEFDRRLLSQFAPAAAFVDDSMDIVHTRGNVSRYLKLAAGRASLNILKMFREGLLAELRNALNRAKKENVTVRKQNVQVKIGNGGSGAEETILVNLEVIPITVGGVKERYFMIVFEDAPPEASRKSSAGEILHGSGGHSARVSKLEQELAATKEYLQSVIETQEATNEELQSANEEILSSNEELQSTNEEMETAKEELQSSNEELTTVNDELRNRNTEMTVMNNDLTNLLSSIDIAVMIVAGDLTIRRFNSSAQKLVGLIPGDAGRPLANIHPSIEIPDIAALVAQVTSNLKTLDKELTDRSGSRWLLRILPYRTPENKIDGAVITLYPHPIVRPVSAAQ